MGERTGSQILYPLRSYVVEDAGVKKAVLGTQGINYQPAYP